MESVQRNMRVTLSREQVLLEKNLPYLATIASVSPYVGLFGTVWGIMNSFRGLAGASQATLSAVAPGISEALVATAIGLFAAIPALVAGVERRILVSPISDINKSSVVLAAAHVAKVTEFIRMGGAHAVAALAYGTKSILPVNKIVGPGNAFVAEAKNFFSGQGKLPPNVRNRIMEAATTSYDRYKKIAEEAVADAKRLANATGVPIEFLYKVPMPNPEIIIQEILNDDDNRDPENQEPVIEEAPADLPPIPKGLEKKFKQKKGLADDDVLSEADQQELLQYWIKMWNRWPPEKKDEYLLNPEN